MFAISLTNITKSFDDHRALKAISISFKEKAVTAVLGKSGSGKTTLLEIINGLIRPDEGAVTILGEPLNYHALSRLRLRIGFVVQQTGLFPHLNVRNNISLLGVVGRLPEDHIKRRIAQLMALVQLPVTWLTKYPHELSGGEQQRVGLCRAMFLNPPILLMDEPFASLDYETKERLYTHFQAIQETEPRTIILVTHDWNEAEKLADEFIWLEKGEIRSNGDRSAFGAVKKHYLERL